MMLKAFVAMRPMRAAEEIKPVVPTKHFNHFILFPYSIRIK